jgi:hypothetical protein
MMHLNDDQIIRSLVDKADLPIDLQEHLTTCPQCQTARKRLGGAVERLGERAIRSAPSFKKTIRIPEKQAIGNTWRPWGWLSLSAVGAAALAVTLMISLNTYRQRSLAGLYDEMIKDERLLTEINVLEKSDLPQTWLDISGDSEVNINEEMLEVITPGS